MTDADRPATHRVDVGEGLELHVEVVGRGSPLVLLHGFTGSVAMWTPMRAALAARHTTIAIDLPGHGRSAAPADPHRYALSRFAHDLATVLDTLAIDQAAVLGYSLGGRAALHFATRHPARLSALLVESASPGIASDDEREARVRADADLADSIERQGIEPFVHMWESLPLWHSQQALPRRCGRRCMRSGSRTIRPASRTACEAPGQGRCRRSAAHWSD